QPSASSPLSNSLSAIAQRNRRDASIWAWRCFWTAHVLTEGGTPETALFTECRCARMLRRQRSRCWLSRTNSEPKWFKRACHGCDRTQPAWILFPVLPGAFSPCSCTKSQSEGLKNRLATIIGDGRDIRNNATLAKVALPRADLVLRSKPIAPESLV